MVANKRPDSVIDCTQRRFNCTTTNTNWHTHNTSILPNRQTCLQKLDEFRCAEVVHSVAVKFRDVPVPAIAVVLQSGAHCRGGAQDPDTRNHSFEGGAQKRHLSASFIAWGHVLGGGAVLMDGEASTRALAT